MNINTKLNLGLYLNYKILQSATAEWWMTHTPFGEKSAGNGNGKLQNLS